MKTTEPTSTRSAAAPLRTDTLAQSVLILLAMTIVQRLVGFGRGIVFCRWLEPEQLGQWDIAFGFLNLAAPLAVLGLPGSFGRYAEYYRQRGQLRMFLRRTTIVTIVLSCLALTTIGSFRAAFADWIFGRPDQAAFVGWLAFCLATVMVHNYLVTLFIAVRMYRVVTGLQFFQSLGFALVSVALLLSWRTDSASVVVAYGLASLAASLGAVVWLRRVWHSAQDTTASVPQRSFWSKLVPFAIWIWVTNLLANLFEVVDRYMILHYSGLEVTAALEQVGHYHTSRIIPLLFASIAGLIGSMITPYLSQDWEAGRRDLVSNRLNSLLKLVTLSLFAASAMVLTAAPVLFDVAFRGKFDGGLAVLPWTLAYCTWFGVFAIAQNYLWCAERARLASLALLAGMLVSVACNLALLPHFGLHGAAWSATAANLVALLLVYGFSRLSGMQVERGTLLITLAPLSLGFGLWITWGVLFALLGCVLLTDWLLAHDDKHQLWQTAISGLQKLGRRKRQLPAALPEPVQVA